MTSSPPRNSTKDNGYLVFVVLGVLDELWEYNSQMVMDFSDDNADWLFCGHGGGLEIDGGT